MNLTHEAQKHEHKSNVFPDDFQERIGRSTTVVRELRGRGIAVIFTDAASGQRPVIEINSVDAHLLGNLGRGHRMVRSADGVIAHGLIVNDCEVIWYASLQQRQREFA